MSLDIFRYPLVKKILLIHFLGLFIAWLIAGRILMIVVLFSPMYSMIFLQYFAWLIGKCEQCDTIPSRAYAKIYAWFSAPIIGLLPVVALFDDYEFDKWDIFWLAVTGVIAGVFTYYIVLFMLKYLIDTYRDKRYKKDKEKLGG